MTRGRTLALFIGVIWSLGYVLFYIHLLPFPRLMARNPLASLPALLVFAGGPLAMVICTVLGFSHARISGGLFVLGGGAAALGLGLLAGPHLDWYFCAASVVVLPPLAAGILMLSGTRPSSRNIKRRPGGLQ